jgi:hypothetical protein
MQSKAPLSMIDAKGRLTPAMVALLNGAFDFSVQSLRRSVWMPYNSNALVGVVAFFSKIKEGSTIAAMVMGRYVIHNNSTKRSAEDWMALICHEESHRSEVGLRGGLFFYLKYIAQSLKYKYRDIPTEVTAYALQEKALALAHQNKGEVITLLNNDTISTEEKCAKLVAIGKAFREKEIRV